MRSWRGFTIAALLALVVLIPSASFAAEAKPARDLTEEDLGGLAWRSVGPANMGGRVAAIALKPGDSTTFYVGYGTGGVFKTTNFGTTFTPIFDKQEVLSIGSIAVADAPESWQGWQSEDVPAAERAEKGKGKIVWVGTGEGNGRNSSSWGGGVYRSTDAGGTFSFVGLKESHDIPTLAVDPRNPDVAYVAALGHLWGGNPERGVYKTTDGGRTWNHSLKIDDATGACDVAVNPKNPETVYAAMYARRRTPWSFTGNSDKGGIFRSVDGGRTWKKLTKGLPPRTGRIGLAIYAKDPSILYATVESDWGGLGRDAFDNRSPNGGVFRSQDGGETWTRLSELNPRPFYFSRIAVDPEDDQRIYLPGWDLGISDDGGRTFRRSGSEYVHVDFHAIAIDPQRTDRIFVGNDGGIYISHDRAETWDYRNTVAVGQFYRVAVDMSDPYRIGGGLQDNGSWIGPSETLSVTEDDSRDGILNKDWSMINGGDGFGVAFDPEDPEIMYATSQGGFLVRLRRDNNIKTLLRPSPREGQEQLRFNWNAPFLISKHDPSILYHGGNRVFRLTERGDQWFAISPDLSRREVDKIMTVGSDAETHGTVVSLAESPVKRGLLWAGTDDGLVHVTPDDGGSWRDVTPKQAGGLYIARIAASAHEEGTAYVAVDGHRSDVFKPLVLMTKDQGRSWTDITGDLPAGNPVEVVTEDPGSAQVLYCGTEFGAFVTLDRGRHWVRMNGKSLPPAPVDDIVVHPREKDLVVGTHGRSIWVLDDASLFAQLTAEKRAQPLALLVSPPAHPRLYNSEHYGLGHGLFRAKNPPMGTSINYWVKDESRDAVKISIANPKGFVVRELDGASKKGLNRVMWDLQADPKHRYGPGDNEGFLGQTEFVPAGTYKITIKMGDHKNEGSVEVLRAANAKD